MRMTLPPRCSGGVRTMTPSGTGSSVPSFDEGAAPVRQSPTRTACPAETSPAGKLRSETMYDRPCAFTPVTIRRTLPGILPPLSVPSGRSDHGRAADPTHDRRPPTVLSQPASGSPRRGSGTVTDHRDGLDLDLDARTREIRDGDQRARRVAIARELVLPDLDEAIAVARLLDEDRHGDE